MKDWDARLYREHTGFVSDLGLPLIELLGPRPGERILDLGCGDGALTEKLAETGCEVVAIDASPDMVEAARQRGLDARRMDAAELAGGAFHAEFDAVFSNAALHWMRPMDAVVRGIHRVLKPGGRLVAELGGEGNVANIRAALHASLRERAMDPRDVDPWYFPSPLEYTELLNGAGFDIEVMDHFDRPTALSAGITRWLKSVARPFLMAIPEAGRAAFLAEVEARLEPVLRDDAGAWRADYVRLRVRAVRIQR